MTPTQAEQKAQDLLLKIVRTHTAQAQQSLKGLEEQVALLIQKADAFDWLEEHHKGYKVSHSFQIGWRIWKGHLLIVKDEPTLLSAINQARNQQA